MFRPTNNNAEPENESPSSDEESLPESDVELDMEGKHISFTTYNQQIKLKYMCVNLITRSYPVFAL